MKYIRKRPFDWLVGRYESDRILVLVGPRQVGKSTLMKQFQEDRTQKGDLVFYITLEQFSYRELLDKNPDNLFQIIGGLETGKRAAVIIDEIQYLKDPAHTLKYLYDTYKDKLKLIVTGSSAFYINQKFTDSLAGRKFIYEMQSLDFEEFLTFKNTAVPEKINPLAAAALMPMMYEYMTYGGYPAVVLAKTVAEKKEILKELAESYTKKDILDYHVASQENYFRILKLLAMQTGNLLNINTVSNQLDIPRATVERYIGVMERSFHIALVSPYFNNKKKEVRKMPKVYFYDTGLRNFLAGNFDAFDLRIDKGRLLENTAYRACLTLYEREAIKFWRTSEQSEVDFVIGDEIAYEVKTKIENVDETKYAAFKKLYQKISLKYLDSLKIIELFLTRKTI